MACSCGVDTGRNVVMFVVAGGLLEEAVSRALNCLEQAHDVTVCDWNLDANLVAFTAVATVDLAVAAQAEEQIGDLDGKVMASVAELAARFVDFVWVAAGWALGSVLFEVVEGPVFGVGQWA